jgi:cytoskeletal protein CcmA (bactofilin family)
LLVLKPTGFVNGNVRARTFVLEEGATFNGDCSIGPKPKAPEKSDDSAPKETQATSK